MPGKLLEVIPNGIGQRYVDQSLATIFFDMIRTTGREAGISVWYRGLLDITLEHRDENGANHDAREEKSNHGPQKVLRLRG